MKEIGLHQFEFQITPEAYLRELFAHTENGVLFLSRQNWDEDLPRHYRCRMRWTEADVTALSEEFHTMKTNMMEAADPDELFYDMPAGMQEVIPNEKEVQAHAWNFCRLHQLEAPDIVLEIEACHLMEALALRRFCTARERLYVEGEPLSKLTFEGLFFPEEEEGPVAAMRTTGPQKISFLISASSRDYDLQLGDLCAFLPSAQACEIKVYPSEDALCAASCNLPVPFMTPLSNYESKEEGPYIRFTGRVLDVNCEPDPNPDVNNYDLLVETSELTFRLNLQHDGSIKAGDVLYGVAWLSGAITKA